MAILTGTRFGSYEILSLIGAGGMGEVYRARDLQLNREVAVKVLLNLSTDPHRLQRFEQEARAAAALNHPNILAVYHMGRYEGAPYLVSELLSGENLRQIVKRGPLPVRKVIEYGVQIAHGLQAAHDRGIVHRDLKPENLFLTKESRVKILDFGLAKLTQPVQTSEYGPGTIGGLTEPGVVMGTVGYMSPEQVRGESTDHRTDIFAFGAVLYEMLTGKRAFQRSNATETQAAILREDPTNILDLVPNLSPACSVLSIVVWKKAPSSAFNPLPISLSLLNLLPISPSAVSAPLSFFPHHLGERPCPFLSDCASSPFLWLPISSGQKYVRIFRLPSANNRKPRKPSLLLPRKSNPRWSLLQVRTNSLFPTPQPTSGSTRPQGSPRSGTLRSPTARTTFSMVPALTRSPAKT